MQSTARNRCALPRILRDVGGHIGRTLVLMGLLYSNPVDAKLVHLSVSRTEASSPCPDTESLWKLLRDLAPHSNVERAPDGPGELDFHVDVDREGLRYRARVTVAGASAGQREIIDNDPECAGLGNALVLALLLIAEPSRLPAPESDREVAIPSTLPGTANSGILPVAPVPLQRGETSSRVASAPPARSVSPAKSVLGVSRRVPWRSPLKLVLLEGLGMATAGVTQGVGAGAALGGSVFGRSGFGLRARTLVLLPKRYTYGARGRVNILLGGGLLGICYRAQWNGFAVSPCLDLGIGIQRGKATGFTTTDPAKIRPWLAAGPSLSLDGPVTPRLRWMVTCSALLAPSLERFTITGLESPEVYRQGLVGGAMGLGLGGLWEFTGPSE